MCLFWAFMNVDDVIAALHRVSHYLAPGFLHNVSHMQLLQLGSDGSLWVPAPKAFLSSQGAMNEDTFDAGLQQGSSGC